VAELNYAYYPGCASQEITKEANKTTRVVASELGIKLHDMPKANCCGAGLLTDRDYELSVALNARILAEAEQMGMDILTICSTCLMVLCTVNRDLKADPALLERTNAVLAKVGLKYSGRTEVKQLLWVLAGPEFGLRRLRKAVTRPLGWLKVAPFYGCHSLRPSDALGFDDPERPKSLESLIRVLGADVVEFPGKTKCCGFQVNLVNEETAVGMTAKRLMVARDRGADCMVTPCPFCHINLDTYQGMAEKRAGTKINLPVFHLAQLVGLAMGLSADQMGLARHFISAERLLMPPGR
jgi:succinate dehydrogenase / fumarate reductase cytochrome b subunit